MKKIVAFILSIMTCTGFIFPTPVFAANTQHIEERHYHIINHANRNLSIEATGRGLKDGYDTYVQPTQDSWYQTIWLDYYPDKDVYTIRTSVTNNWRILTFFESNEHLMYIDSWPSNRQAQWKIEKYDDRGYVIRNVNKPDYILRTPVTCDVRAGDQVICQKQAKGVVTESQTWEFV